MTENPLLTPWTTPFGLPPFGAIEPAHFPPAFEAAMATHGAEVAAIGANPAPPSFANTVEALEEAGRLLSRVGATFFNLAASHATAELQQVERDIAPKLATHRMAIALDPALFCVASWLLFSLFPPGRRSRPRLISPGHSALIAGF
ncbi:MAG: hypothetical protein ACKO9A_26515 [Alphaproteobacteria bacterium]